MNSSERILGGIAGQGLGGAVIGALVFGGLPWPRQHRHALRRVSSRRSRYSGERDERDRVARAR